MKKLLCGVLSIVFLLLCLSGCAGQETADQSEHAQDPLSPFRNGTLGVIDGSLYAGFSRELFPNARIDSYPSFIDLFQCVKQGKIDQTGETITCLPNRLTVTVYGAGKSSVDLES